MPSLTNAIRPTKWGVRVDAKLFRTYEPILSEPIPLDLTEAAAAFATAAQDHQSLKEAIRAQSQIG